MPSNIKLFLNFLSKTIAGMPKCTLAAFILFVVFSQSEHVFGQAANIIPYPQSIKKAPGEFVIKATTKIIYKQPDNKELVTAAAPLVSKLQRAAGITLNSVVKKKRNNFIAIELTKRITGAEAYHITINPDSISIEAGTPAGVFYAVQSLLQLLPAEIENSALAGNVKWAIPAMVIDDAPAFSYRGLMLDVARHYMPYDFLEKMIDLMAMQKMNTLHLHLTDSQGWRFESKKYPKLTQIGAYRKGTALNTTYDYASRPNDTLYGGYYTQEQLKKLVAYAQSKFITIIPEIEMPAHSESALAAYPQFACLDSTGKPFPYPSQIQNEYCTKDSTFIFLTDILSEVMDVFPSKYIHIAGDEASKENWRKCPICLKRMKDEHLNSVDELQSYFIKRIEKFVNEKGRTVIGWDEILEGGLAPNATVMSWRGEQGGIDAARLGHNVVMTPGDYCYFDHYQSADPSEPPAIGGLTTLAQVYNYHPIPVGLTPEQGKLVIGAQGNLWTEYVPTPAQAEYMYFPRSIALAEDTWTGTKQPYDQFLNRLLPYLKRLDEHQVNYSRHMFDIKLNTFVDSVTHQIKAMAAGIPAGYDVYYTTDGSRPGKSSPKYTGAIIINADIILNIGVIYNGQLIDDVQKTFTVNKATGRLSWLKNAPNKSYNQGGDHAWNNGIVGSNNRFNDGEWLGWSGQDFEGTVDLGSLQDINVLTARFFNKPSDWIYMPLWVSVLVSENGTDFKEVLRKTNLQTNKDGLQELKMDIGAIKARYVKIIAKCSGTILKGNPGEGNAAWLFVDEVKVD
ncbi:family 20 glycosylhydrolase [Mucilaginibacter sp. X5P1]|uniref:glycoside hydrolase family 20 protein n=1 Tax=Mucilaginibacter sp. X5P1 TaxID=2723088 RepID=UPI00160FA0F3|nr:family 20 glycosylhydrolase [Mucilaginibacter sp. X5P1]MBB6138585.1 hexosaminidase [Mucilaginibacter sp. X5P1]